MRPGRLPQRPGCGGFVCAFFKRLQITNEIPPSEPAILRAKANKNTVEPSADASSVPIVGKWVRRVLISQPSANHPDERGVLPPKRVQERECPAAHRHQVVGVDVVEIHESDRSMT